MKICFVIQSLATGGSERTVSYLANYGVNNGYEIDVVIFGEQFYSLDPKVKIFKLPSSKISNKYLARIGNLFKRKREFKKYCIQNKPDVIVSLLMEPIFYATGNNIPIIASERNNPFHLKNKIKKIARKFLLSKASAVIFQTNKAMKFYPKLKCKKIVIPNAVGNEDAYVINAKIGEENKICAVGRLCREKDYPTMLQAFKIIVNEFPDLKLEIYGVGSLETQLKELVDTLNLKKNVCFMGSHIDVLQRISTSKCYIMSSKFEGMPNALMEAMAIGLPCVSTDYGNGVGELIDNTNGIVVPAEDYNALAQAVLFVLKNPIEAKKHGENAKKILETNNINIISQTYYEFFKEVAKK